jgi:hypothetical protein
VQQGSVLRPLILLDYGNDIWINLESNIRLFVYDYIIYRKITVSSDLDKLHNDLNRSAEWAVESDLKVNPHKRKAVGFTKSSMKKRIRY